MPRLSYSDRTFSKRAFDAGSCAGAGAGAGAAAAVDAAAAAGAADVTANAERARMELMVSKALEPGVADARLAVGSGTAAE
jgi:hypothetical protein